MCYPHFPDVVLRGTERLRPVVAGLHIITAAGLWSVSLQSGCKTVSITPPSVFTRLYQCEMFTCGLALSICGLGIQVFFSFLSQIPSTVSELQQDGK